MAVKKFITPEVIKGKSIDEIYFIFKNTDTFIGDSETISYIQETIKNYNAEKKNQM